MGKKDKKKKEEAAPAAEAASESASASGSGEDDASSSASSSGSEAADVGRDALAALRKSQLAAGELVELSLLTAEERGEQRAALLDRFVKLDGVRASELVAHLRQLGEWGLVDDDDVEHRVKKIKVAAQAKAKKSGAGRRLMVVRKGSPAQKKLQRKQREQLRAANVAQQTGSRDLAYKFVQGGDPFN